MPEPRAPLSHAAGGQGLGALAVSVALHVAVAVPLLMPHARPVAAPGPPRTMDLILLRPGPPAAMPAPMAAPVAAPAPARAAKIRPAPAAKSGPAAAPSTEPTAAEPALEPAATGTGTTTASGGAAASSPGYSLGTTATPAPDYPWSARRRGIEGRVVLRLEVDADGRPTGIELMHSSGSDALDQAAMAALRQWRLRPALADGVPVAGRVVVPIVFKLT